jgi:hypothetical protein
LLWLALSCANLGAGERSIPCSPPVIGCAAAGFSPSDR